MVWIPNHNYWCGGFGANPQLYVGGWAPKLQLVLCGGLGVKPQLLVWWFWSHTITICAVVWAYDNSGGLASSGGLQKNSGGLRTTARIVVGPKNSDYS